MDEIKTEERKIVNLSIDDILPNRFQPRIKFDDSAIFELSESIKVHGVFQPIIVRPIGDKYEIIAGERRYKASVLAGKTTVPAIVMNINDSDTIEIALIENVQRANLTPIEEAISYKKILDMGYINQESLAQKLGKTQSTIANKLRLLNLDDDVQEALLENKISERHARSLLKLKDFQDQKLMLERIINERLTVRKTDEEISKMINNDNNNPFSNLLNVQNEESQATNPFNSAINYMPVEDTSVQVQSPMVNDSFVQPISDATSNSMVSNDFSQIPSSIPDKPIYNIGDVNNQVFNPTSFDTGVINSTVISSNANNTEFNPDKISSIDLNNIEANAQDLNNSRPVAPMQDLLMGNSVPTTIEPESNSFSPQPETIAPEPTGRFFSFPVEPEVDKTPEPTPVAPNSSNFNSMFNFTSNNPIDNITSAPAQNSDSNNFNPFGSSDFTIPASNSNPFATSSYEQPVFNNSFASVGGTNEVPQVQESYQAPAKDISLAIDTLRNAIESVRQMGYNVIVNEADLGTSFQFIIDVEK